MKVFSFLISKLRVEAQIALTDSPGKSEFLLLKVWPLTSSTDVIIIGKLAEPVPPQVPPWAY